MSLADTAQLIVALKLDDRISGPLRGVGRQIDALAAKSSVRGGLSQIGAGIGIGIQRGAAVAAVGIAAISTQVTIGVRSLQELESVEAQTRAGIESTGGAAGQTAADIRRLAEKYEDIGGVLDDKVIQAGENILLTFTNIRKDAFEPTLEAALDLSTRMDQDLNTSVLQLGKALQDPVRGLTALRRVGVAFTDDQEKQIKRYVELGDTAAAQQVILDEVNREFGGSFAEAGKTSEATIGRFRDSVEGLQQNLATAFIPAIDKVARRLNEIFSDPATIAAVGDFGERLAGFLTDENLDKAEDAVRGVFGYLASVPWGTIGDGLRIAGQAAGVAIDAFKSLPPGVQNALITLLAANKLTGGLVSAGLGQLAAVALGSLKTITAANVTVIGGNVTGGGPGVVPPGGKGPGGFVGNALKFLPVLAAAAIAAEFSDEITGFGTGLRADLAKSLDLDLPTFKAADLDWPFGTRNTPRLPGPDWFADILGGTPPGAPLAKPKDTGSRSGTALDLGAQTRTYQVEDRRLVAGIATVNTSIGALPPIQRANTAEVARNRTETSTRLLALSGNYAGTNARLDRSNASLATIATKNFNPTIKLTNSIRLSPTVIQQRIVQQNVISGFTSNDNSAGI